MRWVWAWTWSPPAQGAYPTSRWAPGSTVIALVSPDGETYVRIGRDAGRSTDDPTLPAGWEIVEIDV